jgi:MYXO-CTERM domain-containing protein
MTMATRGGVRVRGIQALATALVVASLGSAQAAENLTFTLVPQSGGGKLSYVGGASPLIGTDLGVGSITGLETPLHSQGSLTLNSANLSFTTGSGFVSPSIKGETDFAPGGSLEIVGGVPGLGIPAGTQLMSGSFTKDNFVRSLGDGDLKIQGGAFINIVNPTLAAYYGLPTGGTMYLGGLAALFSGPTTPSGAFSSSDLTSGSVTTSPVPEPGTFAVFAALAVGGLVAYRRRAGI